MSAARLQNTPEAGPNAFPVRPYQPSSSQWPYNDAKDFSRHDENDDNIFYLEPRFVEHIDEAAIDRLTRYYQSVLPSTGRVLDLCTSWKSFYPGACEDAVRNEKLDVYGIGLNKEEMVANPLLCDFPERRIQLNLNQEPQDIKAAWSDREPPKFDTVTCVVSIDYISRPLQVLRSIRERTNDGGSIHLVVSNRCFPTKVVKLWLEYDEQQRLQLVGGQFISHLLTERS